GSDTTPPVISAVTVSNVTDTTATITWTTDEPATSQVEYGPTTNYGWLRPIDPTLVTSHSVTLVGLSPGVLYHFRVFSRDGPGNTATSSDSTFTTTTSSSTVFAEQNGQVVIEAEHYTSKISRGGHDWELSADRVGFSGNGYLTAQPNNGTNRDTDYLTNSPELAYQVQFSTPGTYYVWIRGLADTGSDDSLHVGPGSVDQKMGGFLSSAWVWAHTTSANTPITLEIAGPGLHTIRLWMREDGLRVDKLLLRTDPSQTPPQNAGPSEYSTLPRTMCVGDSITRGSGDPNIFGYRDHLQALLGVGTRAFVGTYQEPVSNPVLDIDHEGIGGNLTADVKARLPAALAAHMPVPNPAGSRVLLHIGTNDMRLDMSQSAAVDNIEAIIQIIDAHDPTIAVHVALVVPIPPPEIDHRINLFNAALRTRLEQLHANKSNLFIVDMNTAFKQNPSWGTQYIADGVHPTDLGYQVMAGQWKLSIDANP
ncbi:MAG: GDSL-type esterase/lipase family protein, partial [Gammaproteobacteria bacterium]